jgi:dTDP-4-amino-4,6-dideoxygalactose transaminase
LSPPHMSGRELELVHEAFASNYVAPVGPMMDAFEKAFAEMCGIPHCVALSSGTAALHLALRELGVGDGDEVIASSLTFIGSVSPVTFLGGQPVFIDCDHGTWNMDPVLLAEELAACEARGRLPKAVIPTDLYGQCCDLDRIVAACAPYDIPVIADSAEAVGAKYRDEGGKLKAEGGGGQEASSPSWRHAGYGAWASVYSFNGNKIITSSGGGMLASHDRELIDHARKLATQARDAAPWYEHSEIGYNYRMSNIVAAIGLGQLEVLDDRVARKREICAQYEARLGSVPGIAFMPEAPYGQSNRWLTVILIDPAAFGADTHAVREALEQENIEARPVWKPMHMQPVFEGCRVRGGAVGEELFRMGLCLPSGTAMGDDDVARVCAVVLRCRG